VTKYHQLIFWLVFIISLFSRFLYLDKYPVSLNWDEISHGYNAYSLLKTGRDQWGKTLPIFNFRAYGDYPTALNLYLTIPFVAAFGLNAMALRFPAAILGFLFTWLLYFLCKFITKSQILGLIAFIIASFSPWTFFTSRAVFQSNLAQFFLSFGILLFLYSFKKKIFSIPSALLLGLSMYSYHNTRIVTPLLVLLLFIIYRQFKKSYLPFLLIFLIMALPNLINLISPESLARNRWVGIINPVSINLLNERRRLFDGPPFFNILVNNKVTYFIYQFGVNILNFFNPFPLFFSGSQNYQFNPPHTGLLYIFLLPFFYFGIYICLRNFTKNKNYSFISIAFLISLIPAALTTGDFPSIRLSISTPFIYLFIVLGLSPFVSKFKTYFLPLFFILSLTFFFKYLFIYKNYCQTYAAAWQSGYSEAISYIKPLYSQYNQIVFTKKYGEPHQFLLFYWPWDPASYQNDPKLNTDFHSDWYWVNAFDKFIFLNDWEIKNFIPTKNTLMVTGPNNYPPLSSKLLKTLYYPDKSPVFDIVAYE